MPSKPEGKRIHQLLIEVQSPLYAFVYSLLGNGEDAYDVLQEANLAILAKESEYDSSRSFFTWACRFAQLQVLAHRKRKGRDRLWFDDELVSTLAQDFELNFREPSEMLAALGACLEKLDPAKRAIVAERYEVGKSIAEVASALGRKEGAIRAALYRIRKQLFGCVKYKISAGAV